MIAPSFRMYLFGCVAFTRARPLALEQLSLPSEVLRMGDIKEGLRAQLNRAVTGHHLKLIIGAKEPAVLIDLRYSYQRVVISG